MRKKETIFRFNPLINIFQDLPSSWDNLQYLSFQTSIYNSVALDLNSDESRLIIDRMRENQMMNFEIIQIERIQNIPAYQKYWKEKEILSAKYNKDIIIEKLLFHGTSITDPRLILESEEGFSTSFSQNALWGRGIYFADKAVYSHNYAYDVPRYTSNIKQLFLARVLIGNSFQSTNNSSLDIPPKFLQSSLRYDSVEGRHRGSKINVLYSNSRCYPQYLISYRTVQDRDQSNDGITTACALGIMPTMKYHISGLHINKVADSLKSIDALKDNEDCLKKLDEKEETMKSNKD